MGFPAETYRITTIPGSRESALPTISSATARPYCGGAREYSTSAFRATTFTMLP